MPKSNSKHLENVSKKPYEIVISKIKELISTGILKPGDKLPAERKMVHDFGVGRTHVREALHKLEFYGIIKTLPQSGSVINGLDLNTLDGLISDVLNLQDYDFFSLVETRNILEENAIRLCAERWKENDLKKIEKAHENFIKFFHTPERQSHDFAFHRTIAEGAHNPVVKAMLMIIIPDILKIYLKDGIAAPKTEVVSEHEKMITARKNRNGQEAVNIMKQHLQGVSNFAKAKISKNETE